MTVYLLTMKLMKKVTDCVKNVGYYEYNVIARTVVTALYI